jgi:hypothetical protein
MISTEEIASLRKMTSPSPEPITTDSIHTQRALATMEAFLLACNCPEYTKNVWLYLKKGLLELSTTESTPTASVQDKILNKLSVIKKKISAPPARPAKPSTYADSARLALPHSTKEKLVPSQALKEV